MNVLIVIDMQKSLFANPRLNAESVIENINQMAATVRQHQGQVIYIQHNGSEEENLARGSAGWALLDTLDIQPADLKIEKTICDAFYGNDLLEAVTRLAPERLIIMGCASDFAWIPRFARRSAIALMFLSPPMATLRQNGRI